MVVPSRSPWLPALVTLSVALALASISGSIQAARSMALNGYLAGGLWQLALAAAADALNGAAIDAVLVALVPLLMVAIGRRWIDLQVETAERGGRRLLYLTGAVVVGALLLGGGYLSGARWSQTGLAWWDLALASATLLIVVLAILVLDRSDSRTRIGRGVLGIGVAAALLMGIVNTSFVLLHPRPGADAPNIIFITVDTQRADHLGFHGYERETSPNLDRRAREGLVFENCFSHASLTVPAFGSLMTGLRPFEHGVFKNLRLADSTVTLAEYFKNAGYETAAVVSNYVLREAGIEAGFDHFDVRMERYEANRMLLERTAEATTSAALEWLTSDPQRPFFLWVHYQDPHGPYTAPEEYQKIFSHIREDGPALRLNDTVSGLGGIPSYQQLGERRDRGYYVAQYDAETRYFDASFEVLFSGIETLGLRSNSMILFSSDHGEGMGEHSYYFAHGDFLFPSLLHVPLIIWTDPEIATPGRRESRLVQHADIAPTVLTFAGVPFDRQLPGRDLLAGDLEDVRVLSGSAATGILKCSLTSKDVHLTFDSDSRRIERFDTSGRLLEVVDDTLAGTIDDMSRELSRLCRAPDGLNMRRNPASVSEDERKRLEALGYVQ